MFPHQKPVYSSTLPHTCYMACTSHSSCLITRIIFGEAYRSLSSSLCSLFHSCVTSHLLCPNILLSNLFSKTLDLHSSLSISDQVSLPYKTTGNIIVLYISFFIFLDRKLENKRFCTEWQQEFPDFNLLLILDIQLWFVTSKSSPMINLDLSTQNCFYSPLSSQSLSYMLVLHITLPLGHGFQHVIFIPTPRSASVF